VYINYQGKSENRILSLPLFEGSDGTVAPFVKKVSSKALPGKTAKYMF